jgi:hypothetical protein
LKYNACISQENPLLVLLLLYYFKDCAADDPSCVPKTQSQIDTEQGLINGLFGTGAAIGALFAPTM